MKKFSVLILLMVLAVVFVGCSSNQGGEKQPTPTSSAQANELVFASESEFSGLNPLLEETNLDAFLFRGLMRFDEHNVPINDIAQSIKISDDQMIYTISIHRDVTFHDGHPLTVDDIMFTINSILDDANGSYLKSDFSHVVSMEKVNDMTMTIQLDEPFTPLLDKLTVPILPKHAFEGQEMRTATFNQQPIGAGPYMFEQWDKGTSLTLKAYPSFFGTKASIEKVIFKFIPDSNVRALQLKSGEVDIALLDPNQVEELSKVEHLKLYEVESADYRGVLFNMKYPIWQDVAVRKAISYGTDRAGIVKGILYGYGTEAYSPLQKHAFVNANIEHYKYDLDKASELLEQAGWQLAEDGFRYKNNQKLAFTITAPITDTVRVNMANYVAEGYKEIGADVQVAALDWSNIVIEETEAFMVGWGSPYDADHHTYSLFHSGESSLTSAGYNYGSYNNPKVDALLEEGRTTVDPEKRKEVYGALQEELAQDPPFAYFAYVDAVYGINQQISGVKERILGHHGAGFLWNVEEWKWHDR
ncbi:ABC transporter substrate-binding protein [Lysinibacillus sp. OL1_EC]|uniref:ABC transporter substrate-binding protein n=1 Tax=unclassified Lysinibacillus TaxID=2636778 RepID=UPI001D10EAE2|nr:MULTISPECIES: ABC transporter substrate-binding protein [unclassified Lysinibacillus]MCM0626752.1 ABC transporter substrate-binding protein [Lysinibacillus sp. OL1_EC]WGT38414.1 ABC transporter substrate-binding protein [Lysinibacillus sp. 1 U-2021]